MNWQQTVFYCALTITPVVFLYNTCEAMGFFRWVNRRLNETPAPAAPADGALEVASLKRAVAGLSSMVADGRNDIDKLKLALGFKEFKSKG